MMPYILPNFHPEHEIAESFKVCKIPFRLPKYGKHMITVMPYLVRKPAPVQRFWEERRWD